MSMSIKELASAAQQELARQHQRHKSFVGIKFEVLEKILRMPGIDADLRADLADWLVRVKREAKIELDLEEFHASSFERLALPLAGVVFSALAWVAQIIAASGMVRNTLYVLAFGMCGIWWRTARSDALRTIAKVKKALVLLGKVE
jgi:ribulose 1,5-bisphosphate carboxylase large subunit-like protein